MIWATLSSQSYFCWLYRASPSSATKNTIDLILLLTICYVESPLAFLERVFSMTSVFSWQNSSSLCPTSFCTPRPNLSLLPGSLDFLLLHSSSLWWKAKVKVTQSCVMLCGTMDCSPWISLGQNTGVGSQSKTRDWTQVSHIAGGLFTSWATREKDIFFWCLF